MFTSYRRKGHRGSQSSWMAEGHWEVKLAMAILKPL
jgi:hypothetical protein